ncbi:hypothetical protein PT974_11811 [Cladobotryum mycophilum]|uniref:TATA element modulatory factor 1 TATA binding domain-containing protein n=1 Tax=Cladobotryum mycophilum TaxID=491253 RepID=A0ABR0S6T2_9HYPO
MAARWGTFLSQAVAGVESRLDNILAESDENGGTKPLAGSQQAPPAKAPSSTNSRASSSTRTNDRLQARLAKAMANKNAQAAGDNKSIASPRSSTDIASRESTEQPRVDADQNDKTEPSQSAPAPETSFTTAATDGTIPEIVTTFLGSTNDDNAAGDSKEESNPSETPDETTQGESGTEETSKEVQETIQPAIGQEADDLRFDREMEEIKARHQEEVQEYVERIDSLQSKLQYMSKNAADAAKKTASSAPSGSAERKLAEKDERIALLMEEGQKLAGAEQKYRAMIKKLRLQLAENEKQLADVRQDKDKAAADAEALRSRLNGNEEKEKRQQEALKATTALQREIDALKRDRANKDETIRRLEQETNFGRGTRKEKELENKNLSMKAEFESLGEKSRLDSVEWGEKLERAIERGRSVEAELRVELQTMESKLEDMRATAEEAASGSGGEAQVKLFRQIETLQSQYASARENWQGIEASLIAKSAGLEKEKDEAQRRESEMRKRARDAASRCRALEEELQDAQPALSTIQQELEACREQLAALRTSSKATETALEQARAELEKEKRATNGESNAEAERRQWVDDVAGATGKNHSRPDSPLLSVHRTFGSDMVGLPVPVRTRRTPTPGSIADSSAEGILAGRRPPLNLPLRSGTMSTTGSVPLPTPLSTFEHPIESPLPISPPSGTDQENGIADTAPSSPRHLAQDMISVSTVAAGPSVQLVERMSAAIRRLEAEKVTAKEEMTRICAQRDEARGDIASLMKELEEAKVASSRVPKLEKDVEDLDARYQTTLELLGEKSELVDELRADVEDVKAMYRELVERTVK